MSPDPLRGEIWDVSFPSVGLHPAIVLSVNRWNAVLSAVAVIPVTGSQGPVATHLGLYPDTGLSKYHVSYAVATGIQTVDRGRLRRKRGLLAPDEIVHLAELVSNYLGL